MGQLTLNLTTSANENIEIGENLVEQNGYVADPTIFFVCYREADLESCEDDFFNLPSTLLFQPKLRARFSQSCVLFLSCTSSASARSRASSLVSIPWCISWGGDFTIRLYAHACLHLDSITKKSSTKVASKGFTFERMDM